jgi:hypothetical protein
LKKNLALYSCLSLLLFACNKNKDDSSANSWIFAGTTYKASSVSYVNDAGVANLQALAPDNKDSSSNELAFAFYTPPAITRPMLITNTKTANTVMVEITVTSATTKTFYVSDATTIDAYITVSGGKVSATFPGSIWLHNTANYADSAKLSVRTITQQ